MVRHENSLDLAVLHTKQLNWSSYVASMAVLFTYTYFAYFPALMCLKARSYDVRCLNANMAVI